MSPILIGAFVIFDATCRRVVDDGRDVEADVHRTRPVLPQPRRRGPPYARDLAHVHGRCRGYEAIVAARADFAEHQQIAAARDDIQFQASQPHVASQDVKTALDQQLGYALFSGSAELGAS